MSECSASKICSLIEERALELSNKHQMLRDTVENAIAVCVYSAEPSAAVLMVLTMLKEALKDE